MKDWVKPFLIEKLIEALKDRPDLEEKEEWIKFKIENEIECEDPYQHRLMLEFNCNFGFGLGGHIDYFRGVFTSVLGNLPEQVFKKIQAMKNVFFVFTPYPGAEVKLFSLETGLQKGSDLRIVNFPYYSILMPTEALRGEIVHELAHVYSEDRVGSEEVEDKMDNLAKGWGFEEEIKALRAHLVEVEKEEYGEVTLSQRDSTI